MRNGKIDSTLLDVDLVQCYSIELTVHPLQLAT